MPKIAKYVLLFAAVLLASAVCIVLMFRPRAVNIVYMADARYLPYVMVSLESAIASKNKGKQYPYYLSGFPAQRHHHPIYRYRQNNITYTYQ